MRKRNKHPILHNDRSMYNGLESTQAMKHFDHCCGIHGAARLRAGIKHARVTRRRRNDKIVIKEELSDG